MITNNFTTTVVITTTILLLESKLAMHEEGTYLLMLAVAHDPSMLSPAARPEDSRCACSQISLT